MHGDIVTVSFAIACGGRVGLRERLTHSLAAARFPFQIEILQEECGGGSAGEMRNRLFARARGKYVYFLDEDCVWPVDFPLADMQAWIASGNAFSGPYLNTPMCTFFGRAYNFMTHAWMRKHAAAGRPVPVAGNVFLPRSERLLQPYGEGTAFGGEEAALVCRLSQAGIELRFLEEMAVGHNALHSPARFFARAWRHGRSPAPGRVAPQSKSRKRFLTFHQALPSYSPLMLLTLAGYHLTQSCARRWGCS